MTAMVTAGKVALAAVVVMIVHGGMERMLIGVWMADDLKAY